MLAFHIELRVFCDPDKSEQILKALNKFLPFDLNREKIRIEQTTASSFNEKKIRVYTVKLKKQRHISRFLKNLNSMLSSGQRMRIVREFDSRTDHDFNFYLRLDRDSFLNDQVKITDSGNCFHIKISLALFPKRRDIAVETVRKMFSTG